MGPITSLKFLLEHKKINLVVFLSGPHLPFLWLIKANTSQCTHSCYDVIDYCTICACMYSTKCDDVTVIRLIFMSCTCVNTDHSTVWAKGCGCQSARASWCHQWNCPSTPSPAVRQTCWLLKIQGRSGQSDSAQMSPLLLQGKLCLCCLVHNNL